MRSLHSEIQHTAGAIMNCYRWLVFWFGLVFALVASADTWTCMTIVWGATPTLAPQMSAVCPPLSAEGGGTFQQTATFSLQLYNMQTKTNQGSPISTGFTGTGVCTSEFSPYANTAPVFGPGSTSGSGTTVVGIMPVASATPNYVMGVVWSASMQNSVNQQYNTGVSNQCQCTALDCCNAAAAGQCPATCPPHSCVNQCGGAKALFLCTPILMDLDGTGYHMTDAKDGVCFDVFGTGEPIRISWTARGSRDGWLALPDEQGRVSTFKQLFGNLTPQPPNANPNGFLALAVYDTPPKGGNGDGVISWEDAIWSKLRVWVDSDHDGIAQPDELLTMEEAGVLWISLGYTVDPHYDQWGNLFNLRGVADDFLQTLPIWDVTVQ